MSLKVQGQMNSGSMRVDKLKVDQIYDCCNVLTSSIVSVDVKADATSTNSIPKRNYVMVKKNWAKNWPLRNSKVCLTDLEEQ